MCYSQIGDYNHAIKDFTDYLQLSSNPDEQLGILYYRARWYRLAGLYEDAISDWTQIIELNPTDAYAYYERGWCYEFLHDDQKAMENYNEGIDIHNEYPYIYFMRGNLYAKQGLTKQANDDYEEVLKLDTIAEKGSCRQYALFGLHRNDEALEWMNKIVASAPDDNGIYYDKACLLSLMGKISDAIAALRTSLENGYRNFVHIENDDDLDSLRENADYIALIKEYKAKHEDALRLLSKADNDTAHVISEIPLKKMLSGIYKMPCSVNGLSLDFILDTGASTVSISLVEASFMHKNGYLKTEDLKGKEYFSTATGEIHEGAVIRLREVKIGEAVLENIDATVVKNQQAPLLLGQNILEKFGTITIDNINSKLVIKQ